jgi:hypothetical protein
MTTSFCDNNNNNFLTTFVFLEMGQNKDVLATIVASIFSWSTSLKLGACLVARGVGSPTRWVKLGAFGASRVFTFVHHMLFLAA